MSSDRPWVLPFMNTESCPFHSGPGSLSHASSPQFHGLSVQYVNGIMNGIVFSVSVSDCSLLIQIQTYNSLLVFNSAALLSYQLALVALSLFHSFLHISSCSQWIKTILLLPFQPGCFVFIFLAMLHRPEQYSVSKSGGWAVPVPDPGGKVFWVSPVSMMLPLSGGHCVSVYCYKN